MTKNDIYHKIIISIIQKIPYCGSFIPYPTHFAERILSVDSNNYFADHYGGSAKISVFVRKAGKS